MSRSSYLHLTRRERQIMDVLYRDGEATVADVMAQMPDPPSYSAVRATMNVLEERDTCATSRTARVTSTSRPSRGTAPVALR